MKSITHKINTPTKLNTLVRHWKEKGEIIVFTNGVFDLIHQGHIAYLHDAASQGTKLIIGINADQSVKSLAKGPARPIKDQQSRAIILAAMQFVDAVIIFNESTPAYLINTIIPDVLVKGGDYNPEETDTESKRYIVGRDIVLKNNGTVKVIPFLEGFSTTSLEKKIILANNS